MNDASKNLFPYQKEGIDLICNHYKDVLLADHPGAGKTCQAILAADKIGAKKILVICPASLRENWKREFAKWSDKDHFVYCIYSKKYSYADINHVAVVSYDIAASCPELFGEYDLLILDEAHYLKNAKSKRTKVIFGVIWSKCKKRICITGTPLPNGRAIEGYTLFSRLAPQAFSNWWAYVKTYCIKEVTRWGTNYNQSKNLDALGKKCRELFMIRRDRKDTIGQLPPLVRIQIYLSDVKFESELSESQQNRILEMDSNSPYFSTLRKELGVAKVSSSAEYIEDLLEEVNHIVVFAHHREVIIMLEALFVIHDISFVTITGETSMDDRQAAIDMFQNGKAQVFLASIYAANTGITLTKAHDVVFVEYDWVPEINTQCEGRCYRIGQTEITRSHYLCIPDSIDDKITDAILRKQRNISSVMGETIH